jgi:hypothetical protein
VHRHHLVEDVRAQHRLIGTDELGADEERLGPAGGEEGERGEEVEDPDPLVVGGG